MSRLSLPRAFALSLAAHAAFVGAFVASASVRAWLTQSTTANAPIDVDMMRLGERPRQSAKAVEKTKAQPRFKASSQSAPETETETEAETENVTNTQAGAIGASDDQVAVSGVGRLTMSEYVTWVRTHNHPPAYPRVSRTLGEQGKAQVRVTVAQRGSPPETIELAQSSGVERLDRAALEAVRGWRFPAFEAAVASITITIPFAFVLEDR